MNVKLLKNYSYSLNGRDVIEGRKGDSIEVSDAKAKSWTSKGVIAGPKKLDTTSSDKEPSFVPVLEPVENKMDKQEDKEVKAAPKPRRKKTTK